MSLLNTDISPDTGSLSREAFLITFNNFWLIRAQNFFVTNKINGIGHTLLRNVRVTELPVNSYGCLFFLLSPNGGNSIHWLTNFPGNSNIMVFTSTPFDGKFAFLTDDQQVLGDL